MLGPGGEGKGTDLQNHDVSYFVGKISENIKEEVNQVAISNSAIMRMIAKVCGIVQAVYYLG